MYILHCGHIQYALLRACAFDSNDAMCLTPLTPALVDGPGLLVQVVGVGLAEVERFGVWDGRAVQRVGGMGGTQRQPWS